MAKDRFHGESDKGLRNGFDVHLGTLGTANGIFQASMVELGLLAVLIIILVVSIILLRRNAPALQEPVRAEAG